MRQERHRQDEDRAQDDYVEIFEVVHYGQSNTFTGHLGPALTGSPVKVLYTRDSNGETISHTATTDANGDFRDAVTFTSKQAGRWKAQAFFDGDVDHGASSSKIVQFTVST